MFYASQRIRLSRTKQNAPTPDKKGNERGIRVTAKVGVLGTLGLLLSLSFHA